MIWNSKCPHKIQQNKPNFFLDPFETQGSYGIVPSIWLSIRPPACNFWLNCHVRFSWFLWYQGTLNAKNWQTDFWENSRLLNVGQKNPKWFKRKFFIVFEKKKKLRLGWNEPKGFFYTVPWLSKFLLSSYGPNSR